jgi:phenylacetate-coenzyme A ligase PaaK-like adenylate-forming protein
MTGIDLIEDLFMSFKGIWTYNWLLKKSCTWEREKIEQYQYVKLKKLLVESGKNVPYYTEIFNELGFDPQNDFKSIDDLSIIPVLTKAKAREVRHLLDNPRFAKNSIKMRTSGSTGQPFEVNVSKNAWVMEQAVVWRHWKWSGYNFRDKMAIVRSFVPGPDGKLTKRERFRNFLYFSPFHLNDENMAAYLDKMIQEEVKALRGYPSTIYLLANFVLRTNHPIPKLKLILVASEELRDEERKVIETAFKSKVTNHYGLAEICVMMGDCAAHNGLHNYDEHAYLELLESKEENKKKIIGTNLHNYATPLIRYDTGDQAIIGNIESSNTCKHSLLTIKNISGRADLMIKTPEGFEIATVNFYTLFETYQEIFKWQIIQRKIDEIEVRLLADSIHEERISELRADFFKRLPDSIMLTVLINEPLVQKYEGKINPFLSMI